MVKKKEAMIVYKAGSETMSTGFSIALCIQRSASVVHSPDPQGYGPFQDGHIDVVPNVGFCGELGDFLGNSHVLWKNRTKHGVRFLPLFVVR